MHAWEAIQKSLDYIEENLSSEIKIETLAGIAALSPFYYQRLFARLVRKPVLEYVKLRRLAKASQALKNNKIRISELAFECGFSDHANFTRAYKAAYGMTPEQYREHPVILNQFVKPELLFNYVMVDEDVPLVVDGIVIEVTRKTLDRPRTFIGLTGDVPFKEFAGGRTTGVATTGILWDEFHRIKPNIQALLPNGNELGVLYLDTAKEGHCTYLAAGEANGESMSEGTASFTLPCGEYIVCCFEAENFAELIGSAVFKASTFMNTWMKKHTLTCGDFSAELYYGTDPEARSMEQWLPIGQMPRNHDTTKPLDKIDGTQRPTLETINAYVNSPLWEQLCTHLEDQYQSRPVIEYSRCSMEKGWNVKYAKAGRSLCTLYPLEGHFIALVVIGKREWEEMEALLPEFTPYLQQLYHATKTGMNQKWLMIDVTHGDVLEDVMQCIAIRRGIKKKTLEKRNDNPLDD
jgi:AraC family transcriptional regulator